MHNCRFSLTLFALASIVDERLGRFSLSALLQSQVFLFFILFWRGRLGEDGVRVGPLCAITLLLLLLFILFSSTPFLADGRRELFS
jgi:hypothetical protein